MFSSLISRIAPIRLGLGLAALCAIVICNPLPAAEDDVPPLRIPVRSGWEVEYRGAGSYSIKNTASESGELLIMPALSMSVDKMRALLEELAKKYIENSKQSEFTKLDVEDPTPRELKGEQFSGFYTEFTSRGTRTDATFAIRSADKVWWGQYSGAAVHWPAALAILRGLKNAP